MSQWKAQQACIEKMLKGPPALIFTLRNEDHKPFVGTAEEIRNYMFARGANGCCRADAYTRIYLPIILHDLTDDDWTDYFIDRSTLPDA